MKSDREDYALIVRSVESNNTQADQKRKIVEEFMEFMGSAVGSENEIEECTDLIQACFTYLEHHCGGICPAWRKHLDKMEARGWKERGRDFIGCDLEASYCRIGEQRLAEVPFPTT